MQVTQSPSAISGSQTGGTPAAPSDPAAISSDFETFIKMLTVQMQNQDPLNPVDSADYAVQLATFSTVEQQVRTNDLLTGLSAQIGALSVAQLSGWVGMQAKAEMPVHFDGSPVRLTIEGSHLADATQLVVRSSDGTAIQRQDVTADRHEIDWAGVDDTGAPLPAGIYDVSVESFSNGELIETTPVQVHARIVEARNDAGRPLLVMDSGQEVLSSDILGLKTNDP